MHNPCKPIPLTDEKQWVAELSKLAWISWICVGLRRRTHQDLMRIATDGTQACRRLRHKQAGLKIEFLGEGELVWFRK
jgi:hypothetical protein